MGSSAFSKQASSEQKLYNNIIVITHIKLPLIIIIIIIIY